MEKIKILWADDEIDLLKPHILFLEQKGYQVSTVNNGIDAIEKIEKEIFDIVLLDENMPGLSGLETLNRIKIINAHIPVVMITKSEEEHIMEDAIGNKIADYLIKPVNPNQILLSLKKNLENKRLVSEKVNTGYQQEFRNIGMSISDRLSFEEWCEVYKKLIFWEMKLESSNDKSMYEIFEMQKKEANNLFSRYIEKNYEYWLSGRGEAPVMSHTLFKSKIAPHIKEGQKTCLILIDNLRFDQWKVIQPLIEELFRIDEESIFTSILPTATQYARNALFAGLLPSEIEKRFPKLWLNDEEEGGKNLHEEEFLNDNMKRLGLKSKTAYIKVTNNTFGKKVVETMPNYLQNDFVALVYNFVDMLSHARTEMEVIRELADNEAAYRSLTLTWFKNSPLFEIIKFLAEKKVKVIITTDHGTIKVTEPTKVIGDKNTNTNLRYKNGKSLDYNAKDVFVVKNPAAAYLPKTHISSAFIFAKEDKFFAYPNNYNYYVNYYKNTFQHGGISLEEMLIPFIVLTPKS